jgi:hypothetical protein
MGKLTKAEKLKIWAYICEEFPDDEVMQEIHFVRQVHYLQTKDLSVEEHLRYFRGLSEKTSV